ncbi:MAG: hypothetical protein Kapaf2KO_19410 [Candidatus Kapaibacteriales bacterium]
MKKVGTPLLIVLVVFLFSFQLYAEPAVPDSVSDINNNISLNTNENIIAGFTIGLPGMFNGVLGYQYDNYGVRLAAGAILAGDFGWIAGTQIDLMYLPFQGEEWKAGIVINNGSIFSISPFNAYTTLCAYVNAGGVDLMLGYGLQWPTEKTGFPMASIGYVLYLEE